MKNVKDYNNLLNEGKNDKKIKELEKEIKSLKDENEEGFETEIKELEFELGELKESENFADNPSMNESKVLTGEEVAKALRKLDQKYDGVVSKDFIIKVKRLKRVTKETLEKMGAKGKILDDIFDL